MIEWHCKVDATPKVMFTVDLEPDWGCGGTRAIKEITPRLLNFMSEHDITATFFVVADVVEECWPILNDVSKRHEIASHGLTHKVLSSLAPEDIQFELKESKRVLEQYGWHIRGFRAPFFKIPKNWSPYLERAGYSYDSSVGSVYPSWRNRTAAWKVGKRGKVIELPISSLRDGLSPFSLTSLRLYRPLSKHLLPNPVEVTIFYLHLHELLDAEPNAGLSLPMRFVQRRNHGEKAWQILEKMVDALPVKFVSCMEYITTAFSRGHIQ